MSLFVVGWHSDGIVDCFDAIAIRLVGSVGVGIATRKEQREFRVEGSGQVFALKSYRQNYRYYLVYNSSSLA